MATQELADILIRAKGHTILVAGDVMLDRFIYGDVDRISPESPVPVLSVNREDVMLGGAGNVVSNLCALDMRPVLFAVTGADDSAAHLRAIAETLGADVSGLMSDPLRPTTIKTRYLARHQQLLRTDIEKIAPLDPALEQTFLSSIEGAMGQARAVILSDYGKGVLTDAIVAGIIAMARRAAIPVLVDPKGHDYARYRGADIVTPNRKELGEATGAKNLKTDQDIVSACRSLIASCGVENIIATRSEDGLTLVEKNGATLHIKAAAREVFDVSGAGDTVIAVAAAALAGGASPSQAAEAANIAGGIAVGKVGTAPVRLNEILSALSGGNESKLRDEAEAAEQVLRWKAQGLRVGFTNGCFDILHKGHVGYLSAARKLCDRLIVGVNRDASVRLLKGPSRPVNDEGARAAVLSGLSSVDMAVYFGAAERGADNTPSSLIAALRPDVFFKGGDYTADQLPEGAAVRAYGGEIHIMPLHEGYSTTSIIEKSRSN